MSDGPAGVVEPVDTPALGAGGASRGGSSPSARTAATKRRLSARLRRVATLGADPALGRLGDAVLGRRGRRQGGEQFARGLRHGGHRVVEGLLVGLGRLREPADLAHVLERGRALLLVRRRRLEVVERADVAAHGAQRTLGAWPAQRARRRSCWSTARTSTRRSAAACWDGGRRL